MTTRIYVSPPTIQNNEATGRNDPTVAVRNDEGVVLCHEAVIHGPSRVVYDRDGKEKYGARVFVQTESTVDAIFL